MGQLYNLGQSPISDGLREYLLNQVSNTPPQQVLDQIKAKLDEKKLSDWFDKLTFPKTASVDDFGKRPQFFVTWNMKSLTTREILDNTHPLVFLDGIEISLRDSLRQEIIPPEKLSVLHGYNSEGYRIPTTWFYCLPEEVEILKKKALDDAMRPFQDVKEIDFSKSPESEPLEVEIGMNLRLEGKEDEPSTVEILDQAAAEIPAVPDDIPTMEKS